MSNPIDDINKNLANMASGFKQIEDAVQNHGEPEMISQLEALLKRPLTDTERQMLHKANTGYYSKVSDLAIAKASGKIQRNIREGIAETKRLKELSDE